MKAFNYVASLALAAYTVLALTACPSTNNGSDNSTSAVAATQCVLSADGTYRNQYGQSCSPTTAYGCAGYTYNAQTGTYVNPANPTVQIPAAQCGGTTTIPNQGYGYGGTYVDGCAQWSSMYGVQYVPVQMSGQLVCVNYQYLNQQIYASYPQYQYTQWYQDPSYWYSYAPTAYDYGYYGQGNYGGGCYNNISLGISTGGFGAGVNLCF